MRIVGPHRERDRMLREGVIVWAAVRLRVQEALALLWTLLESVPLGLPLCPCEPEQQLERAWLYYLTSIILLLHRGLQFRRKHSLCVITKIVTHAKLN